MILDGAGYRSWMCHVPLRNRSECRPYPFAAQVKEFQDFRRSLPQDSQIIVCKNTLMKKATERVERFLPLDTALAVRAASGHSSITAVACSFAGMLTTSVSFVWRHACGGSRGAQVG
jgi:Ribosomal protein L10